jgi:hypothetical protein
MRSSSPRRSAWWSRSRGLPKEAYAAWLEAHRGEKGPARILAWARTPTGFCIGGLTRLSITDQGSWTHTPWHLIERGEWNAETRTLRWKRLDGGHGSAVLSEPGRMPELFRERIAATIALERFVPLAGERGVIVTARRNLVDGGSISWHTTLTRGLTWQTDGVREAADRAAAELQTEWDAS